jgi:5-methylcytosine-specific restriction protein A
LFRYTGEGQKGNQKLSRGNLRLADATKNGTKIHLFRQHSVGGLHEYLGEVKVASFDTEVQKDAKGNQRTVFVFMLRPMSSPVLSEDDATDREIDSEVEDRRKFAPSRGQLEKELDDLRKIIAKRGPERRAMVTRTESEYKRFKRVVVVLKLIYNTSCQVCGSEHFETERGVYSEVHHLLRWSVTHDDAPENLVVLCANCHRKLHNAKASEIDRMFKQLTEKFPHVLYRQPPHRGIS